MVSVVFGLWCGIQVQIKVSGLQANEAAMVNVALAECDMQPHGIRIKSPNGWIQPPIFTIAVHEAKILHDGVFMVPLHHRLDRVALRGAYVKVDTSDI